MKGTDLILMAPAIAFAGGLSGLIQYVAHPGAYIYLATSAALFVVGTAILGGLFLLIRDMPGMRNDEDL